MLTAKLGNSIINCYDGKYNREALKEWANKDILLCPVCGKSYEYCHGKIQSPYFRYKDKQDCLYEYYEPETEEHIKGKIALYEWVKSLDGVTDVVLEGWIPETKQRPDIMFKKGDKQFVIEHQCSPLATKHLERHQLYQAAGIYDIWILGLEKYKLNISNSNLISHSHHYKTIESYHNFYFDYKRLKVYIPDSHINKLISLYELRIKNYYEYNLCDIILDSSNFLFSPKLEILQSFINEDNELVLKKENEKEPLKI